MRVVLKGIAILFLSILFIFGITFISNSYRLTVDDSIRTIQVSSQKEEQVISSTMTSQITKEASNVTRETEKEASVIYQAGLTKSLGAFKMTAYCPCSKCCGKWAGGITSTGVIAQAKHTIAVDPSVIPYGSKVIINDQVYTAEDCGGAIKGNHIDIYFDTHEEASSFGVQCAEVFLVIEQ